MSLSEAPVESDPREGTPPVDDDARPTDALETGAEVEDDVDESDDVEERRPLEDLSLLEDKTPDWFQSTWRCPLLVLVPCLAYLLFSSFRLSDLDLWGHLAYGRWIAAHGLPETEPLLPLAKGMPFIASAWLSQWLGYQVANVFGFVGLKVLNGLGVAAVVGIPFVWLARRTGSVGWAAIGALLSVLVQFEHLIILRPQLAGLILFSALLVVLDARPARWHRWAVPVGFLFWANLHGSFVVGLGLMAAFLFGRAIDVLRRTGRLEAIGRDHRVRRTFVLLQLAAIATLLNPHGLGLHVAVLAFSSNPNLISFVEWQPLAPDTFQGRMAFVLAVAVFLVHRGSPRRASSTELLLLVGLGAASFSTSRMIVWWGIVAAWSLVLHGAALGNRRRGVVVAPPAERAGKWTVVAIGLVWIAFGYSPLGLAVIHGDRPTERRAVEKAAPLELIAHLREYPPTGLVFTTAEWGDYLQWAGPEGIEVFANSHVHALPEEVWADYLYIAGAGPGCEELLKRYAVNTVVLDRANRGDLIDVLHHSREWWTADEYGPGRVNGRGDVVFVRREPIFSATTEAQP